MNQAELIDKIANVTGQKKVEIKTFLAGLEAAVHDAMRAKEEVVLLGIGKFAVVHKESRAGRNPATGETITIAGHDAVKFKPLKALRDLLK